MAISNNTIETLLTHQDMCHLFGLEEDDLPTSSNYENEILNHHLTVSFATSTQTTPIAREDHDWQPEITQPALSQAYVPWDDATSSASENQAITLLKTAVLARDGLSFEALVKATPWSNQTPADVIAAIRMAFALEAPLLARYLAEQGIKYHATHPEIKKIARILAPPVATAINLSPKIDVKANQLWLKANRESHRCKWVALHNGKLIAFAQTFSALRAKVGDIKGKGILLTQVT